MARLSTQLRDDERFQDDPDEPAEEATLDPRLVEGWAQDDVQADTAWITAFEEAMALDPAVQIAEEHEGQSERVRDRIRLISDDVKAEVRRAHHVLGHPAKDTLLAWPRRRAKARSICSTFDTGDVPRACVEPGRNRPRHLEHTRKPRSSTSWWGWT